MLEQWRLYKRASEEIHGYLMEGQYSISRLRLLTGSPEAVLVQVENLEVLELPLSPDSKRIQESVETPVRQMNAAPCLTFSSHCYWACAVFFLLLVQDYIP